MKNCSFSDTRQSICRTRARPRPSKPCWHRSAPTVMWTVHMYLYQKRVGHVTLGPTRAALIQLSSTVPQLGRLPFRARISPDSLLVQLPRYRPPRIFRTQSSFDGSFFLLIPIFSSILELWRNRTIFWELEGIITGEKAVWRCMRSRFGLVCWLMNCYIIRVARLSCLYNYFRILKV